MGDGNLDLVSPNRPPKDTFVNDTGSDANLSSYSLASTVTKGSDILAGIPMALENPGKSHDEKPEDQEGPEPNELYDFHQSRSYLELIPFLHEKEQRGAPFSYKWNGVKYMKCSPDGRWLVVCYGRSCVVYDVNSSKDIFVTSSTAWQILMWDDNQPPVEHAEWSPDSKHLLTRTRKNLELWQIPAPVEGKVAEGSDSDQNEFKSEFKVVTPGYKFHAGYYRYMKWINNDSFLLMTNGPEMQIFDRVTGHRETCRLNLQREFRITEVFPLTEDLDRILCLATRAVNLDDPHKELNSEGVDYILVLRDYEPKRKGRFRAALKRVQYPFDRHDNASRGVSFRDYVVEQRSLLRGNVASIKICKKSSYLLINYVRSEGAIALAPELWRIGERDKVAEGEGSHWTDGVDAKGRVVNGSETADANRTEKSVLVVVEGNEAPAGKIVDINVSESKGTRKRLPVPIAVISEQWGEAYFVGPTHDIILCEKDGDLLFFHFNRGKDSLELRIELNFRTNFNEFKKPFFTWGDAAPEPLMFAMNRDGRGRTSIFVWSSERGDIIGSTPEVVVLQADAHSDPTHNIERIPSIESIEVPMTEGFDHKPDESGNTQVSKEGVVVKRVDAHSYPTYIVLRDSGPLMDGMVISTKDVAMPKLPRAAPISDESEVHALAGPPSKSE